MRGLKHRNRTSVFHLGERSTEVGLVCHCQRSIGAPFRWKRARARANNKPGPKRSLAGWLAVCVSVRAAENERTEAPDIAMEDRDKAIGAVAANTYACGRAKRQRWKPEPTGLGGFGQYFAEKIEYFYLIFKICFSSDLFSCIFCSFTEFSCLRFLFKCFCYCFRSFLSRNSIR